MFNKLYLFTILAFSLVGCSTKEQDQSLSRIWPQSESGRYSVAPSSLPEFSGAVADTDELIINDYSAATNEQTKRIDASVLFGNQSGWADYADDYFTEGTPFELAAATTYELPINAQTVVDTYLPEDVTEFYVPTSLAYDTETANFTIGDTVTGGTSSATGIITAIADNGTDGTLYLAGVTGTFADDETITDETTGSAAVNGTLDQGGIIGIEGEGIVFTVDLKCKPSNPATTYIEVWVDIGGGVGELYRRIISFPKGNTVERPITLSTAAYTLDTWESNRGTIYIEANNTADVYEARVVVFRIHKP